MVHPVKTPLGAVRAVTRVSMQAVRHPLRTAGGAAAVGRGLVATVVTDFRPDHHPVVVEMDEAVAEPAPTDEKATLKRQGDPLSRAAGGSEAPGGDGPSGEAAPAAAPAATAPAASPATEPVPADATTTTAEPGEPHDAVATEPS